MFKRKEETSLPVIGFLQAAGLVAYCSLIALIFWQGEHWFGKVANFLGPLLFLTLFIVSALICALIALGYPVILFWEKKKKTEAIRLIAFTAGWLVCFVFVFILLTLLF